MEYPILMPPGAPSFLSATVRPCTGPIPGLMGIEVFGSLPVGGVILCFFISGEDGNLVSLLRYLRDPRVRGRRGLWRELVRGCRGSWVPSGRGSLLAPLLSRPWVREIIKVGPRCASAIAESAEDSALALDVMGS